MPDPIVGGVFEPLWDLYEGSVRLRTMKELERSQWWPRERLQAAANEKLRRVCEHAVRTSSFYRERFAEAGIDPAGVQSIDDLQSLPLLTKNDVRQDLDRILSTDHARQDLVPAKTGGSTGVALNVFCDARGVQMRNAAALRSDQWSGWRLGQPMAAVWGNPPQAVTWKNKLRGWLKDRIIYLDTMRIDDAAVSRFLTQWDQMKPGLLYGHAHSIYILAEALRERGETRRPTGIVATSMMLIEQERRVIEDVFAIPVTNRYGCEEVSLIGCECEEHHGMHLNLDHSIVEFLRPDGTPCDPGEDGRIVVTELINHGMPMIRYEVGDRGVPSPRECPCGRGLPLMEKITGRSADFLVAEDGFRVAGISIIENSLTKFPGIRQLQIVQNSRLILEVNVVPDRGYSQEVEDQLLEGLRGMLGRGMSFEVKHLQSIPQEASGKYRFTICRI